MTDSILKNFEPFFVESELIIIVDAMSKRYGKLPHEILQSMTIHDFSFNVAVMCKAIDHENSLIKKEREPKMKTVPLRDLGIIPTVIKKE